MISNLFGGIVFFDVGGRYQSTKSASNAQMSPVSVGNFRGNKNSDRFQLVSRSLIVWNLDLGDVIGF